MKFKIKRILAVMLVFCMMMVMMPVQAFAEGQTYVLTVSAEPAEGGTVYIDTPGVTEVNADVEAAHRLYVKVNEGYKFTGWYKNDSYVGGNANVAFPVYTHADNPSSDNYVAKFEKITYTVTFDSDGGSAVEAQTINEGNKVTKPADPTKEGYTFKGWFNGETEYDFDTAVTAPITLKAKWEAEPVVTKYDVWVAGTQVTSDNAADVLGDGAASYNPTTNTLTVSKNITATGDNVSAIKATTDDDFTIAIDGSVAISSEDGHGIDVQNKAIVTGGSLTITADSYGIYADEITVDGGTYIVSGWRGLLGESGVAISNATVTITAKNNAIYSYNDKCYISISKSTVTATSTDNRSIFIEEDGEEAITISDSTVTVTGDNCAVYAPKVEVTGNSVVEMKATTTSTPDNDYCALGGCGDNFIVAETLEVLASTEVDGSNPVPYVKADRVNYDWVKIAAPAPTLYDVWVIGTQVTSANASDVLGDGAASYDPATNTLTVKKDISSTTKHAIKAKTEADFTVDVEGKVKMDTLNGIEYTGDGMMTVIGDELIMDVGGNAVYSGNDLKIECEKLDIESGTHGIYSGSGDVVINNTQINISRAGYAGIVTPYGDVTVNNKVLNITGAKEAILVSEKGKNGKASLTSEEIILSTGQNSIEVIGGDCEIKCKKLKITSKWNGTHIVGNLNISADEIIVVANSDGLRTTKEYNLTIDCDVMDIQSTRTDEDADFNALSCKGTIKLPEDVTVIAATEVDGDFEEYDIDKNATYDHVKIGTVEEQPETTSVTVTKVWNVPETFDRANLPQSVMVALYAGDEIYGEPVTLNKDNNWTCTWSELLASMEDGTAIAYTVDELEVPEGYTNTVEKAEVPAGIGFTITNTLKEPEAPETVDVAGTKTWAGDTEADRPASIIVNLLANGEAIGEAEVTASTQWTFSFNELPKYDESGEEIEYSVQEEEVEGYTATYDGYNITNTLKETEPEVPETVTVAGTKTWVGDTEADRPESIIVNLLANGEVIDETEATKETQWTFYFNELPKYDETGAEIEYSVQEEEVEGYTATYDGYNITNTLKEAELENPTNPEDTPNPENKPSDVPHTGDSNMIWLWLVLMIISGTGLIAAFDKKKSYTK